jgi:biotin-dependent carboxylase-like uncharacterized protein
VTAVRPSLEVLATGPLALIQDLGRPGLAAVGVGRSGAADRASFRLGARLLAQDDTAAAIEVTFGGLEVRAHGTVMLALTGAPAPALVGRIRVAHLSPFVLHSGDVLRLGVPTAGLRSYLSVRGGIDVPAVLGSRSTDVLSGLGPAPLRAGDVLAVGPAPAAFPHVDVAPLRPLTNDPIAVRAAWGPRADWLAEPDLLGTTTWTVSSRSDRVGIRLEGTALRRHPSRQDQELPSEGVVRGAVQVPPGGEPVLFLADHPVTGGYPVAAVVRDADVDRLAQAVPGQSVRIALTAPA